MENNVILVSGIVAIISFVLIFRKRIFKFISSPVKEEKKKSKILDGSLGFMMDDPDYNWMQDPYDKKLYYVVDIKNRIIFPEVFFVKRDIGSDDPEMNDKVKNMISLCSPVSYSLIEWNKYVLYKNMKNNRGRSTFYDYINHKKKKRNDLRLYR